MERSRADQTEQEEQRAIAEQSRQRPHAEFGITQSNRIPQKRADNTTVPYPMSDTTNEHDTRNLKIWQQNLNRSLEGQLDLLQSMKDKSYDIAAIQEPHIDFLGQTRSNPYWMVLYPK